ncbi:MAG: serine--tRNA ligase [Candidatus Hydrogenedentota bacterium]|nr:serine--tRNA ligase [Candidatus Sumerlaea chitinivorans]RMH27257.1 MAG: serine--tRNA ligase [Candidatus Hydrogenedentota bacterium]GIX45287.1 MAG: serine--tRNA ligase [Candidatus Sumerlaea sp.]
MLDLQYLREHPEEVRQRAKLKNVDVDVDTILRVDANRRETLQRAESLRHERRKLSEDIGKRIKAGEDAEPLKEQVRRLGEEIKILEDEAAELEAELKNLLLRVPNLPHESVPVGKDESQNRVVREWGEKPTFDFTPLPHWEIGEKLGIINFEQGSKITGSGFIVYAEAGARLQRALINFMLDMHVERHGYREVYPPFVVSRETMTGTGQLPKFEDDLYRIDRDDLFLIPTAEVPVTNLRREEILNDAELPLYYVAYTPCFRREAGSYGKETRGITRVHQFDKVEMVKLVRPEDSFAELETLVRDAEDVLQALGLHYRVVEICTGDLGFSNCKQYDLEVWAPGMGRYLEVSSCSNFTDFQARRANIRFRREPKSKPEFVHTLNGSGLALPRTMIAILETYQRADGRVIVPEVLRDRMKCDLI